MWLGYKICLFWVSFVMGETIEEYFDFVLPLVKEAGKSLLTAADYEVETKQEVYDLVTVYDRKIEDVLIKNIKKKWPQHKFIGEEESEVNGISELTDTPTWIIDPIDGTANFVRNMKFSGVSVGLVINKVQMMGIVYNPFLEECFTAIKGKGAFLNGEEIKTNGQKDIQKSIFNYELSLARNPKYYELYMYRLKYLMKEILG
nr:inositol monophosphatase 1-like [Leptinotarsa decemlineata]